MSMRLNRWLKSKMFFGVLLFVFKQAASTVFIKFDENNFVTKMFNCNIAIK